MVSMPDWFAKTSEMIASDTYFSLADAGNDTELIARYKAALYRLDNEHATYGQRSKALEEKWSGDTSRIRRSLQHHFVGDWIYYRYYDDPVMFANHGGAFWPQVPSWRVIELVREGTRLAIHKALGNAELTALDDARVTDKYLRDLWRPENENGVDIDGVRPLATSWNCVAPAGDTYFEVAALRGPSVVEFAMATPRPLGHSSMMHVVQRQIDGYYTEHADAEEEEASGE
jgi:hypothetical protein